MPSETRQIIFSNDEVVAAIQQLYLRFHQAFPKGSIWDVTISEDHGCQVDCDIMDSNNFRERVTVNGEKLAAALILFCITRKVPLPAAAPKTLSIVNKHLALRVVLGEAVES